MEYVLDLENSVPDNVDRYFFVGRTTGNIMLIGNLRDDPDRNTEYTVSRCCCPIVFYAVTDSKELSNFREMALRPPM